MRVRGGIGAGFLAMATVLALTAGAAGAAAAPTVDGADPLAPVLPGSVPAIPATGVPLGDAVTILNGVPEEFADQTTIYKSTQVGTPDGRLELSGFTPSGRKLGLSPGGDMSALTVATGGRVEGYVTGVKPGSTIAVYLLGATIVRQDAAADASGVVDGPVLSVPVDHPTGPTTLQINAVTETGVVQSVSWGVVVKQDQVPVTTPQLPTRLNDSGWTRLVREPLRTNAGQRVRVIVRCGDAAYRDSPSRRGPCRVDQDGRGWTRVRVSGDKAIKVEVSLRAPATEGYVLYVDKTRYRTKAVR